MEEPNGRKNTEHTRSMEACVLIPAYTFMLIQISYKYIYIYIYIYLIYAPKSGAPLTQDFSFNIFFSKNLFYRFFFDNFFLLRIIWNACKKQLIKIGSNFFFCSDIDGTFFCMHFKLSYEKKNSKNKQFEKSFVNNLFRIHVYFF